MESSRNGACVNARWLRVQWATVLTQILFGVNSWAISASGVMEVFALYLHSHRRPLRIVCFVTNPSCCSLESLYSVCVCVHIVQCCQVCSLYCKLVQTQIRHISELTYRGACTQYIWLSIGQKTQTEARECVLCSFLYKFVFKYATLYSIVPLVMRITGKVIENLRSSLVNMYCKWTVLFFSVLSQCLLTLLLLSCPFKVKKWKGGKNK